ncbi:MAG: protein serine/threonine phosphatase [Bacteroidetes bacterium]|nr:MAG: protein serine/threonine phosphatase [Bacteroidota bacterium]
MIKRTALLFFICICSSAIAQQEEDSLLSLLRKTKTDFDRSRHYTELAYLFRYDNAAKSIQYADSAIVFAKKEENDTLLARAYCYRGIALGNLSRIVEERKYYRLSLQLWNKSPNRVEQAKVLNNIALNHWTIGKYDSAAFYGIRSLALMEKTGYIPGVSNACMTLGNIYVEQKKYKEAIGSFEKAEKLVRESGNDGLHARLVFSIGNVYNHTGNYEKCLEYYMQGLKVFEEQKDTSVLASAYNNIGTVYDNQKKYDQALEMFEKTLRIREKLDDEQGIGSVMGNIAGIWSAKGDHEKALGYYNRALEIARRLGIRPDEQMTLYNLSDAYASAKNFEQAYRYLEWAYQLRDTIFTQESDATIGELIAQNDAEQKELRIAELERDKEQEQQLSELKDQRKNGWIIAVSSLFVLLLVLTGLIFVRYRSRTRINRLLEIKNDEITHQKKEITDSINYARRIQESIMPPDRVFKKLLPGSFIYYAPKDIVSGDFYWIAERDELVVFAAVDCTGHGVPGAMMSVVGFNLLEQAVNEKGLTKPSDILSHLDWGVNKLLRQDTADSIVKDGMDLALCTLNRKTLEIQYAGVFNPLYHYRNGELTELKPDKTPIGVNVDGKVDSFTNHSLQLLPGDSVYIFSDGYADQFGGPYGKKFKTVQLRTLFKNICTFPPAEQRGRLEKVFYEWKGNNFQVDDVLIIGLTV